MVDGDEAVASMVTALEAQFGGNVSGLVSQVETIANDVEAISSAVTIVEAATASVSAGGFMRLQAIGSGGGATARFDLQLNVGTSGTPNFKSTGFYLEVTGTGAAAASRIVFDVDQFMVGTSAADTGKQFMFEASGGVVKIRNALIGQLTADNIAAGAITADKMSVGVLSAITANLGYVSAGAIADNANPVFAKMIIDLNGGYILIRD
jgi:hypothetical protein